MNVAPRREDVKVCDCGWQRHGLDLISTITASAEVERAGFSCHASKAQHKLFVIATGSPQTSKQKSQAAATELVHCGSFLKADGF